MSLQIESNVISCSQAETMAYSIYRDINKYVEDNLEDFKNWCMNNDKK